MSTEITIVNSSASNGILSFTNQVGKSSSIKAAKGGANIGTKLEYVYSNATGSAHNIERLTEMLRQLQSVGVFVNAAGRSLLNSHLDAAYSGSKRITSI